MLTPSASCPVRLGNTEDTVVTVGHPCPQASGERYHVESHPEHMCGAYPYAYPPMPAMVPHHGFEDWSQIRYPPPPMGMEHPPPIPGSRLFHLVSLCPPCRVHPEAAGDPGQGGRSERVLTLQQGTGDQVPGVVEKAE